MQIGAAIPEVFFTGKTDTRSAGEAAPVSLEEGDVISAKVLSNENGGVSLKTQEGYIIRARLEGTIDLVPGSETLFVVSEKRDGVIYMRLAEQMPEYMAAPAAEAGNPPDKELLAYARQLSDLNIPVTEKTVLLMREIIRANPDISPKTAAFLAANEVPAEPATLIAAEELASGEAKTADMLDSLVHLVREASSDVQQAETENPPPGKAENTQTDKTQNPQPGKTENPPPGKTENTQPGKTGDVQPGKAELQNPQSEKVQKQAFAEQGISRGDISGSITPETDFAEWITKALERGMPKDTGESALRTVSGEEPLEAAESTAPQEGAKQAGGLQDTEPGMQRTIFRMLTQMPAFEGVAKKNLLEISDILQNIFESIKEGTEKTAQEKLPALIEEVFVRLGDESGNAGAKIKKAREELYVRLSYFEESLSRSDMPGKNSMIEQTQRLMEHVRLLNNIEQFIYMQIPLQMGERRDTAELYIYKQKQGSKRIDPDNVKVLLSLDLMHLGHLEAFVQIKGKNVSLQFDVESVEAESTFKQNTIKLHKMLAEVGYKLENSVVKQEKKETNVETALLSLLVFEKNMKPEVDLTI